MLMLMLSGLGCLTFADVLDFDVEKDSDLLLAEDDPSIGG